MEQARLSIRCKRTSPLSKASLSHMRFGVPTTPLLPPACTEQKRLRHFLLSTAFISPGHNKNKGIKEMDCVRTALCINTGFQSAGVFLWYPSH